MRKSIWAALAATGIVLAASPADASKGQVLWTFSAGYTYPAGLGFDGSSIWVSNLATATKGGTNAVHRHDPSTFAALSTFGMGSGRYYHGLAFGDGRIYTDNLYSNVVTLNTSGTQVAAFPAQGHAYGVAFDPATRHLYQVDMTTAILHTLDPATGASIASVPTTVTGSTGGIAWDGANVWIVGVSSGSIYRVDPDTGATVTSFAGRFGAQIEGITFDGRCLWLSDTSSGDIMVVDHGQADLPACVFAPPSAPVVPGGGAAPASPPSSTSPPSPSNPLPTSPNGDATLPQSDDTDVTSQPACTCAFAGVAGGARSFSAIGVTAALALALARRRRH